MDATAVKSLMAALAPVIADHIGAVIAPLREQNAALTDRLAALESREVPQPARGEDGEAGRDGKDGDPGRDGKDGEAGRDGKDGEPGRDGKDGEAGSDGKDGKDGQGIDDIDLVVLDDTLELSFDRGGVRHTFEIERIPGKAGEPGKDGADGQPGKLEPVRVFRAGEVHYEGDVVEHQGSTWQARKDTAREPPADDWQMIAAGGRDGADGRSFRVAETWDEEKAYAALDVVALNGGSFVARSDDPGPCPGPGWQMLAQRGKSGAPGPRGAPGPKGDRGDPGQNVVALAIDEQGMVTLVNGDGSSVQCDFYPLLERISRVS